MRWGGSGGAAAPWAVRLARGIARKISPCPITSPRHARTPACCARAATALRCGSATERRGTLRLRARANTT
eukprot:14227945-Alexandrium_andersonii.AAC.1